jgi:thioesterase domain-containing protein
MSIIPLSFADTPSPLLVLIHDISGSAFSYLPLANSAHMANTNIYALSASQTLAAQMPPSFQSWASEYAALILNELRDELQESDGRMILGGWSMGGILAVEIARILTNGIENRAIPIHVLGVMLIDTYAPWHPAVSTPSQAVSAIVDGLQENQGPGATFDKQQLAAMDSLMRRTTRGDWPGLDSVSCPVWLITPGADGANGLEEWMLSNSGGPNRQVIRIAPGQEGCDHFSMMTAPWIEEIGAKISEFMNYVSKGDAVSNH